MNEMLTSAPQASAPNLTSVSSSDAGLPLTSALSHRSIKNAVHFVLDDDDIRTGQGHPQHNLVVLRRLAPDLLGREKSTQIDVSAERKRAGWETDCLLKALSRQDAYALARVS